MESRLIPDMDFFDQASCGSLSVHDSRSVEISSGTVSISLVSPGVLPPEGHSPLLAEPPNSTSILLSDTTNESTIQEDTGFPIPVSASVASAESVGHESPVDVECRYSKKNY